MTPTMVTNAATIGSVPVPAFTRDQIADSIRNLRVLVPTGAVRTAADIPGPISHLVVDPTGAHGLAVAPRHPMPWQPTERAGFWRFDGRIWNDDVESTLLGDFGSWLARSYGAACCGLAVLDRDEQSARVTFSVDLNALAA